MRPAAGRIVSICDSLLLAEVADGLLADPPHAAKRLGAGLGHAVGDGFRGDWRHAPEEPDSVEQLEGLDGDGLERPLRVLADE